MFRKIAFATAALLPVFFGAQGAQAASAQIIQISSCAENTACLTLTKAGKGILVNKTLNLGGPGKLLVRLQGNLVCAGVKAPLIGKSVVFNTQIGSEPATISKYASRLGSSSTQITFEDILVSSLVNNENILTVSNSGLVPVVLNYSLGGTNAGSFQKEEKAGLTCKFFQGSVIGTFIPD